MAFVLLLLLSITTLVQVETRSAQNTQQQTQARMNALLGLQQALGQLQQSAGHDQRVTATGSLWANPAVGTEHLVGVWSSEDTDGDGQPDGAFQRWLVSNDDDNAATPDAKADSVNFVTLARPVANDGSGGYTVTNPDFVALVGLAVWRKMIPDRARKLWSLKNFPFYLKMIRAPATMPGGSVTTV